MIKPRRNRVARLIVAPIGALLACLACAASWAACTNPSPPPAVPVYHSNPGALRFVYLDFDGNCDANYRDRNLPAETWPPFDTSGDPNAIHDIWERVAEDMAPFDVDVTTQWPNNMSQHFFWQNDSGGPMSGIRIVIAGGDVLNVHGKAPSDPLLYNIAYVDQFQSGNQRRTNRAIAQTVSHEIGHTFSFYLHDVTGAPVSLSHYTLAQHNLSAQGKTPILGSQINRRDIWWKDPMVAILNNGMVVYRPQEDMMVLWAATGFRADDHMDKPELGSPLTSIGSNSFQAQGIVTMNAASFPSSCALWGDPATQFCYVWRQANGPSPAMKIDKDFFRFRTANAGLFFVKALTINNPGSDLTRVNLDAEIELWRLSNSGVWSRLPETAFTRQPLTDNLSVSISVSETSSSGAEYAVAIKSAGQYGDLGQYTVTASGSIVRATIANVRFDDPDEPGYVDKSLQLDETDGVTKDVQFKKSGNLIRVQDGPDSKSITSSKPLDKTLWIIGLGG